MARIHGTLVWLFLLLIASLPGGSVAGTPEARAEAQRTLFQVAEQALADGNRSAFRDALPALADYPLYPYLLFADLESRLERAGTDEVRAYLEAHGDTPYGERLRHAWLTRLAREQRWADLVEDFTATSSTTLNCYRHQALLRLGRTGQALEGVERIWLHGRSLPDACDPVLDAWRDAGLLTDELAWGRIRLALEAGQFGLARYVKRYLPDGEQVWVRRWLALLNQPARVAEVDWHANTHPRARQMLEQTWLRLARQDPKQALASWRRHGKGQRLPEESSRGIERAIALWLILEKGGDSLAHLASLPEDLFDAQLREWRVRAALAAGDWHKVLGAVEAMDTTQRSDYAWRYWRARALEQLGRNAEADALFTELAEERNFYGFLAADRAGRPYRIGHRKLRVDEERVHALAEIPALQRAREWLALGRHIEARREWERTIAGLGAEDLKAAARLASDWEWHDRAIFTVARAQDFDDVELRFPLTHTRLILAHASRQGINPAWALAVARQESAFMEDARSPAGALGLMQVMPATGRNMARHAGIRLDQSRDLLRPEINVPIGTYYLRRNLDRFGGHPMLSTAAYNAGAHRVDNWLPENGQMDADVWAELIPFSETRAYVRRVFAYQVIYEMRLGLAPTTLSSLLPPVTAPSGLEAARMAHNERWDRGGPAALARICDAPGYDEIPCS